MRRPHWVLRIVTFKQRVGNGTRVTMDCGHARWFRADFEAVQMGQGARCNRCERGEAPPPLTTGDGDGTQEADAREPDPEAEGQPEGRPPRGTPDR